MARILIASQPIAGHLFPLLPVATELRRRGHELHWYTGRKYAAQVRATGAHLLPFTHARDYDDAQLDAAFPGRAARQGLSQLQFDLREVFVGQIEAQLLDLQLIARHWPWDLTLADQTLAAALLHEELGGPPCVLLGVLPLGLRHPDAPPFGLGLAPTRGTLGRLRNAALHVGARHLVFGAASRDLDRICARLGLPARDLGPPTPPTLLLQASVPEFEYPLDRPPQVQFIGPLVPATGPDGRPPWWNEIVRSRRPVVVVTQGTLATDPHALILPVIRALAREDLWVVVAGLRATADLGPLPDNVRTATFVPFSALLPFAHALITNGGYGGVQQALLHDLPVLVCGATEDKPEVARRVTSAGVGLRLRTPSPVAIRRLTRRLLTDPTLRAQVARVGAALRAHDAPHEAADAIERLLERRRS